MNTKDTETLNLPLRKVHALEILRGEKVREYRAFNDHWAQRLCTFDGEDKNEATGIKEFKKIHFYPLNGKWFLDCEVKAIILREVGDEFLMEFGNEVTAKKGDLLFIIRLGKVIATDLQKE